MGLENVIGNLLTCIIPLAGGSQVGLGGSSCHAQLWALVPRLWGRGLGGPRSPPGAERGPGPRVLCHLGAAVGHRLSPLLGLLARVSRVSPGSLPGTLRSVCLTPWVCLSPDVSVTVCPRPRAGVSNRVSLPVCLVQLDSVEDSVVWTLCFFCPPRPCPCPWSEALSFLCSTAWADRGQAWPPLMPGHPPRPVPPRGLSARQAGLRPQSSGLTRIWSEPLSTGPSLCTENHLFRGW